MEVHSFESRGVAFRLIPISHVLRSGRLAQILVPIVVLVSIDVVDLIFRPFTRHVKPRKAVGEVRSATDHDGSISELRY